MLFNLKRFETDAIGDSAVFSYGGGGGGIDDNLLPYELKGGEENGCLQAIKKTFC